MKNKNQLSKIKKDYSKICNKLYRINLSPEAMALYGYLVSLSEDFDPGQKAMRKTMGWGKNKTYEVLKELINRNLIKLIREEDYGKHRLFEFVPPRDWL